jgi:hypothetical protein
LRLHRRFGRPDRVAVRLLAQRGIDQYLILERAVERGIGLVADDLIVELSKIGIVAVAAARA